MIVYEILSPSNKRYFGITYRTLEIRKQEHFYEAINNSHRPIHKAIRKYGEQLIWRVHSTVSTWEEACELEQYLIAGFNTCVLMPNNMGYNNSFGGEGNTGYKWTEEQKKDMSKKQTGKKHTEETKKKMSDSKRGIKNPKLAERNRQNKGKKATEETKKKMSISHIGGKRTEETKKKMSEAQKGEKNGMYGKKQSYEMRRKVSKKYHIITPDNVEFCIIGLRQFCKDNNLSDTCMGKVSKGEAKQHKGYRCYLIVSE